MIINRTACAAIVCSIGLLLTPTPSRALDNPLTVRLRGTASHLPEAAATIFGSGANVLVDVTRYRAVDDGVAVTLNGGSCTKPGAIVFGLKPFAKYGSVTELSHSLTTVAARARTMVIHKTASPTSPAFACGRIDD